ncbi:flagellar hook-associated protein 1 FlgK [Arthrobacter pigmenti]|uniref:Flagellar hook-associated protein 1 n=1 Tax=Arthrobacter pigmenti TaxID=271432 RepID=A0A846RN08_9MICC|nr:flagellar hook-associated protein FlgK [Arthrobacter pigmenti]NJC21205.1 flagellar hook-associated protein 1 FlgK [Arthrobacter pigmenti]
MSTFSGLNTAYTGLVAASRGLDVVGQNIANANTDGYTRQRVDTSAAHAVRAGMFSGPVRPGQGVFVDGIARLGDAHLDARVRVTGAASGFATTRAEALAALETTLNEPGENGISAGLGEFWASWQNLANNTGKVSSATVVLDAAGVLSNRIATGYRETQAQWGSLRRSTEAMVAEVNSAAVRIAELNVAIRTTTAAGTSANELIDQRAQLAASVASLAGGTVRDAGDGTIDVLIGGNALVSGDTARPLQVAGARGLEGAAADVVRVEWAHRPGVPAALDGGEIAGALTMLAATGAIAEAAGFYNTFAQDLASQVNAVHRTGATADGRTGLDFFTVFGDPAALNLGVVPGGEEDIAAASPGAGALDGSIADAVAGLGAGAASPDSAWTAFVTELGSETQTTLKAATLAGLAASSAVERQLSGSAVSMDEEQLNLLTFQHAYQGAARVMTAVDQMLDTLINRTGIVGR